MFEGFFHTSVELLFCHLLKIVRRLKGGHLHHYYHSTYLITQDMVIAMAMAMATVTVSIARMVVVTHGDVIQRRGV